MMEAPASKVPQAARRVSVPGTTRRRVLERALRLGRMLTDPAQPRECTDLAKALGVSRRTLYRDLDLLRSVGLASDEHRQKGTASLLPMVDFLGTALTLREAAALLLFFERRREAIPCTLYHDALHSAGSKLAIALRREFAAVDSDLQTVTAVLERPFCG